MKNSISDPENWDQDLRTSLELLECRLVSHRIPERQEIPTHILAQLWRMRTRTWDIPRCEVMIQGEI